MVRAVARPRAPLAHASWEMLAIALGLVVATQPIAVLLTVGVIIVVGVASFMTPMAAIAGVLVLSPLKTLIATEAAAQIPLDIGQIGLAMLITAWLGHLSRQTQRPSITVTAPIVLAILLFVVTSGASAFVAVSVTNWLGDWLKWIEILLVILMIGTLVKHNQWSWLIAALVVGGLANALVGLYEFLGGSGADHLYIGEGFFRAFGTFGQPNPFGGFMGLLLPVVVMAAAGEFALVARQRRSGLISPMMPALRGTAYALISLIMLAALVGSWSRGAWLGAAIAFVVTALTIARSIRTGILLLMLVVAVTGIFWVGGFLPPSIVDRLSGPANDLFAFQDVRGIDVTPDNYAVIERLAHWQAALGMAASSPFLGVGLGNYEVAYNWYRMFNWLEPLGHAHNYYLNLLAETGIIGLLGYGKAWVIIYWTTWRGRRHPDVRVRLVLTGLFGSWTYFCVHSLFDNLYVNNLYLHLGVMLGLLFILCRPLSFQGILTHGINQFRIECSPPIPQST